MTEQSVTKKSVFIIGTRHSLQNRRADYRDAEFGPDDHEAFKKLVLAEQVKCKAALIAEEMDAETVLVSGVTESICHEAARESGLGGVGHLLADPNKEERKLLGIEDVGDILQEYQAELFFDPRNLGHEEREVEAERLFLADARVTKSHMQREAEWLRRLKACAVWPVLFICGALHVKSFTALLESEEFEVTVLHKCWLPDAQ